MYRTIDTAAFIQRIKTDIHAIILSPLQSKFLWPLSSHIRPRGPAQSDKPQLKILEGSSLPHTVMLVECMSFTSYMDGTSHVGNSQTSLSPGPVCYIEVAGIVEVDQLP